LVKEFSFLATKIELILKASNESRFI